MSESMDQETYTLHFKELADTVEEVRKLARALGAVEVASILAALEATFYLGDISHVQELADLTREFAKRKLEWIKEMEGKNNGNES